MRIANRAALRQKFVLKVRKDEIDWVSTDKTSYVLMRTKHTYRIFIKLGRYRYSKRAKLVPTIGCRNPNHARSFHQQHLCNDLDVTHKLRKAFYFEEALALISGTNGSIGIGNSGGRRRRRRGSVIKISHNDVIMLLCHQPSHQNDSIMSSPSFSFALQCFFIHSSVPDFVIIMLIIYKW